MIVLDESDKTEVDEEQETELGVDEEQETELGVDEEHETELGLDKEEGEEAVTHDKKQEGTHLPFWPMQK